MSERSVALLGRPDEPTDAVEEYCRYLGAALQQHGVQLDVMRISWAEAGWRGALRDLRQHIGKEPPSWIFLQYTALAWSRRAFPWRVLGVLRLLKRANARCAVVFHDVDAYFGSRPIDHVRRSIQLYTMRNALRLADLAIFTVPLEKINWAPQLRAKSVFIPVGANLPSPERAWKKPQTKPEGVPQVAVFSITGGSSVHGDVGLIAETSSYVTERLGPIRLLVFGRNALLGEQPLREKLQGKPVELTVRGIVTADEIVQLLGSSDAMLFQRGPISSRRGSAIAGIACGLPVIGCEGPETGPPITDAGVVWLPPAATHEFGPALLRVLSDPVYRASLAERSRETQRKYFSWEVVATNYVQAIKNRGPAQ